MDCLMPVSMKSRLIGFISMLLVQKVAIGSEAAFEGAQQGREQTFFQFFGLKVGVEALSVVVFNAQGVPIERHAPSFGVVIAGDFL